MRKNCLLVLVCAMTMALVGCGKTHDGQLSKVIAKNRELVDVLKGVTDEASAKAAEPKIKAIAEDMKTIQADDVALGKPTKEEEDKIVAAHQGEMKQVIEDIGKEQMRIAKDPKASAVISKAVLSAVSGGR